MKEMLLDNPACRDTENRDLVEDIAEGYPCAVYHWERPDPKFP